MKNIRVIDHPLVQHKLTHMRKKETSTSEFRNLLRELSLLMGYEATRSMELRNVNIETPISGKCRAAVLSENKLALITILRAGNGLLDGMLQLLPTAKIGHVGLYRDSNTNTVVEYYFKVPKDVSKRKLLVLDPMLATGQSAVAAVSRLKEMGPKAIELVCVVASPEGLAHFQEYHPEVIVYTASIDKGLNENNYIIPGLGDAGDRLYGTQ